MTTWGESHGESMGCVLDGFPAGLKIDLKAIKEDLKRDVPYPVLTRRVEENRMRFLSGVYKGRTLGTPVCMIIRNGNVESDRYKLIANTPRPGHADLTYRMKYGHWDWRGGSRASGRTWAPMIPAGSMAKQLLDLVDVQVSTRILVLGGIEIEPSGPNSLRTVIQRLAKESEKTGDATGGLVELSITGLPGGIGSPWFWRFQADIGHAILNIPGIKSYEVGAGLAAADLMASEFNDELTWDRDGNVKGRTNNAGGVLGGITNGAPFVCRFAVKPTPSILVPQRTVDLRGGEREMITEGRFDANYTPRVQVIAEAIAALVSADHLMISGFLPHDSVISYEDRLTYVRVDDS
ncbi:MAG: chorismate synthase [Thermoplasmata archaeon]|nr:chorismate synthase [Thermoplasmata archaeon]NIT78442.1 chorismate synthase [Thermoplasmata archaeon]NIU50041.1 chorismate synthase [Thermoplasmata archaeon]NIV79732.1 chorismate synthase [Thermoplasmata archaeon]NIW83551.1 chorismate synthase [Thermoplasmata archaeon]